MFIVRSEAEDYDISYRAGITPSLLYHNIILCMCDMTGLAACVVICVEKNKDFPRISASPEISNMYSTVGHTYVALVFLRNAEELGFSNSMVMWAK
jgi:hypothetical protein